MKLKNTIIFSDSRSTLEALAKFPFKSNNCHPTIIDCKKLFHQCSVKGLQVTFTWVPSHCNIFGNDRANRLANDAIISGDLFPYKNYCCDLISLSKTLLYKAWGDE